MGNFKMQPVISYQTPTDIGLQWFVAQKKHTQKDRGSDIEYKKKATKK